VITSRTRSTSSRGNISRSRSDPIRNLVGLDARRIKYPTITPIFTKGELPRGKKSGD